MRAVPRGQTITLAYRPAEHVQGIVVDAAGKPAAGVRVAVEYEDGAYHATTDARGRFDARVPAVANEVTVRLLRPGEPGANDAAVKVRAGDTGIRLVRE